MAADKNAENYVLSQFTIHFLFMVPKFSPPAVKVICASHLVVRPPQPLSTLSSDTGMAVLTKPRFLGPGGRTSRKMLKFPHAHQTKVLNALNYLSGIELTYGSGDMFEIEGLFLNFKNKTAAKESSTSILDASGWRP